MTKISANVLEAVGNTPLVRLNRVTAGISATVCVKLEASQSGKERQGQNRPCGGRGRGEKGIAQVGRHDR